MPRGKRQPSDKVDSDKFLVGPRRAQTKDEWGGFVNVSLDEAHREEFDLWWSENEATITRELDDAVGTGLKFTLSYDGGNCCYIASLTGRPDVRGERPFTCCLSGRGGTLFEALAVLLYKHTSLLHADWWDAVNQPKPSRFIFG